MVLTNPFFWAFLATVAMVGGDAIQGSPVVGRSTPFGLVVVATVMFGRVVLVLPPPENRQSLIDQNLCVSSFRRIPQDTTQET